MNAPAAERCVTCGHFTRGRRIAWAGVCSEMPKRNDGSPMVVATGAPRCYFAVSRWQATPAEQAA